MRSILSICFAVVYNREFSVGANASLPNFLIGSSFTSMDSKSNNNATGQVRGGIFGGYPNDEEASNQIETDMDS